MPSTFDRAVEITQQSLPLAVVPVVSTLLSGSKVAKALAAGGGGGVTFPFPSGLPTLWTYVSLPSGGGPGGVPLTGPLAIVAFVPLFVVGLLVSSALEAGFLGALNSRIEGGRLAFGDGVRRFTLRILGVNLIQAAVVVVVLPLLFVFPPAALLLVIVLSYLLYGLPFAVVVRDVGVTAALEATVERVEAGGEYARFGVGHLLVGAAASLLLSALVRNTGVVGIALGAAVVAVPAVVVAAYGLLVFRESDDGTRTTDDPDWTSPTPASGDVERA